MSHRVHPHSSACRDFEQGLVLYYYGECEGTERSKVEKHLEVCASCLGFLEELAKVLPLTVERDHPSQAFWEDYSREIKRKLAQTEQKSPWWTAVSSLFRPWPVPALATALVLILALTLTLARRAWRPQELAPEEVAFLEILPMAENLEFFKTMDLLDALDLLEAPGGPGSGPARDGART